MEARTDEGPARAARRPSWPRALAPGPYPMYLPLGV